MKVFTSVKDMQEFRNNLESQSVGFVPTMGALHDGHLALVKKSLNECDSTIVSIFLNPTQFNNSSDLENYPSNIEEDLSKLKELNVSAVFTPKMSDMYPDDYRFKMTEREFSRELCGEHRPGHFDGVLTIVLKLLNITRPFNAYFGEKDFQQLTLIKDMAQALFLASNIVSVPTVREKNGLAMSSRNERLSSKEKQLASKIYETISTPTHADDIKFQLQKLGFDVDYVVDKGDRRFVAATLSNVRLIDNIPLPEVIK